MCRFESWRRDLDRAAPVAETPVWGYTLRHCKTGITYDRCAACAARDTADGSHVVRATLTAPPSYYGCVCGQDRHPARRVA
jgi:hypothetical protein